MNISAYTRSSGLVLTLALPVSLGLSLVLALPAQMAPDDSITRDMRVDSKWIDNLGSSERVVFDHVVRVPGSWMRLFFDQTNLPRGSFLRLTSLHDLDVQTLDGLGLAAYGNASCYLNGGAIRIELVAGANSRANRVLLVSARIGVGAPETICGPTDDRVKSFNKKQGRFNGGCTGWLFGVDAVGSAGHCANTNSVMIVEFNVPNSTSSGRLVRSKAIDQYPTVLGTAKRLSSGVGNDWSVARMGRNSQSGKLPGDVQGAWYDIGPVPGSPSGQSIRITGYGTSSVRILNQVQKTHVGPLVQVASTSLRYATDTTGGNSGSPIVHTNTRKLIGVHTHGGCSSSGGSNLGTRVDRADFQAAIKGLIGKAGGVSYYGTACPGSGGTPNHTVVGVPNLNRTISLRTVNLPRNAVGLQFVGASRVKVDLTPIGMRGCFQWVSLDVVIGLNSNASGVAQTNVRIPYSTILIGLVAHTQQVCSDTVRGTNVVSNAAQISVGFQ